MQQSKATISQQDHDAQGDTPGSFFNRELRKRKERVVLAGVQPVRIFTSTT